MACYSLASIAEIIGATVQGDSNIEIYGIAPINLAQKGQITFLDNASYKRYLASTNASAVILAEQFASECNITALIVRDPYLSYAKAANLFVQKKMSDSIVHPSALIDPTAKISSSATIGANCVIGPEVCIGDNTIIEANCYVGELTTIGNNCYLAPQVTIYKTTTIGNNVTIHSGVVIASDGFGYANDNGTWFKVPQMGGVEIGDDVEIGANTCIDRGALNNTIIGKGVKLDNLIQIAHNVVIGEHSAIAACVAIAGSTKIGKYCMIGGCSAVGGHLELADRVYLTGKSMVTHSIKKPGVYSSCTGVQSNKDWHKSVVRFRQLDKIARKVTELERIIKINQS